MTPGEVSEWRWRLNEALYFLAEYIARWIMPERLRYACYLDEVQIVERTFPAPEHQTDGDREDLETMRAQLARRYRVNHDCSEDDFSAATTG